MTWSLVTVLESPSVDLPSEVTADAQAALIRMGWQPPPNQEPTGSFFLPKGGPMKLTRHQADLVLRHYTAEYAERAKNDRNLFNDDAVASLARELSWRIDADLKPFDVALIVEYWLHLPNADTPARVKYREGLVNFTVNEALDNARVGTSRPHAHILRYSEQETTHMDFILSTAKAMGVPLTEAQVRHYAPGLTA